MPPSLFATVRRAARRIPRLRSLLGGALFRNRPWETPFTVADSGGLYLGDSGAVVYREFPLSLLREDGDATGLEQLMAALADGGVDRDVHLAIYSWEEQAAAPDDTPAGLAAYLAESHTFFVPVRRLVVGVKVNKLPAAVRAESRIGVELIEATDMLLGETFPDLSAYEEDRMRAEAILEAFGGIIPRPDTVRHLEAWYTLGSFTDLEVAEMDDAIVCEGGGTIELVAAAGLAEHPPAGGLVLASAGRLGATATSVRATVRAADPAAAGGKGTRPAGTLERASIILGRRAAGLPTPWPVTLRRFAALRQRPLPMRQLDALNETLPGSVKRLAGTLTRLRAGQLAAAGFSDTQQVGDDAGLFVGLAGVEYSYPAYLNPSAEGGRHVTLVTGAAGAGKTFTCEQLAVQAHMAGLAVTYLAGQGAAGSGLPDLTGCVVTDAAAPGGLNPYGRLDAAAAHALAERAVAALVPELSDDEISGLRAGFRRAAAMGEQGFDTVFGYADSSTAVAKVKRAALRRPEVAALIGPQPPLRQATSVVDVSTLADSPAACDLACALHIRAATGPALVVLDDVPAGDFPMTLDALAGVQDGGAHVIFSAAHPDPAVFASLTGRTAGVLAHAETEPHQARNALRAAGLPNDDAHLAWLSQARPEFDPLTGELTRGALGIFRDRAGRTAAFVAGPVPSQSLGPLTRGRATRYPDIGG